MRCPKTWILYGSIGSVIAGSVVIAGSFARSSSEESQAFASRGETQIAGPSVMLRLQREGAPVLDLRRKGRRVPGAVRVLKGNAKEVVLSEAVLSSSGMRNQSRAVALLGETSEIDKVAQQLRSRSGLRDIYLIPSRMLEYYTLADVKQLTPRQLRARLAQMRVLDVSEAEEFAHAHVPGSRRVAYEALRSGDRSVLPPRGQPVALI